MRAVSRFMNRRLTLAGLAVAGAALVLAGCNNGDGNGAAAEGDMALGAAEGAAVTVIEYASVTCVHCAAWNQEVWPEFKAKYVDTNRVRYIFREFPTDPAIAPAGFILARCAGEEHYFEVIDGIMRGLPEIQQGQARPVLLRVAQSVGMNQEQFETCVQNPDNIAAMEARSRQAQEAGVSGTPTFMVNGTRVQDFSLAGLSGVIDPLLGDAAPAAQPATPAPAAETPAAAQATPAAQPAAE